MTKSVLKMICVGVAATVVLFAGCGEDGMGGESRGEEDFLSRFSESNIDLCEGKFTLTVKRNIPDGGELSIKDGTHCYGSGTDVTITVSPNPEYVFIGWEEMESSEKWDTEMRVTINSNLTLTAKFWRIGSQLNPEITYSTFTDQRDGKNYRAVRIGDLTWMAENLNYCEYGSEEDTTSYCYASRNKVYGMKYFQQTGMGVCPSGWRLPDTADWRKLVQAAGGSSVAGKKLKSKTGWDWWSSSGRNGTDDFGFSALPAGCVDDDNDDCTVGGGGWWIDTQMSTYRGYAMIIIGSDNDEVYEGPPAKPAQLSVRCVQ